MLVGIIALISILWILHISYIKGQLSKIEMLRAQLQNIDTLLTEFIELRRDLSTFVIEEKTDITPLIQNINVLLDSAEKLTPSIEPEENMEMMQKFTQKIKEYKVGMMAYHQEILMRKTGEGVRSWEKTLIDIENDANATISTLKNNYREEIGRLQSGILKQGKTAMVMSIIIGIAGVLSGIAVAFLLQKILTRPISDLVEVSKVVADGDLRPSIDESSDPEMGPLISSISGMIANLRQLVTRIRKASVDIKTSAGELQRNTTEISEGAKLQSSNIDIVTLSVSEMDDVLRSINSKVKKLTVSLEGSTSSTHEMAASIKEISDFIEKMFDEVARMTASLIQINANMGSTLDFLNELSSSSQQANAGASDLNNSISKVGASAKESRKFAEDVSKKAKDAGASSIKKMIEINRKNKSLVDDYSRMIQSLGTKSSSIGQILDIIRDLADRTNLLSINAAIISSQAGEHGHSFSVIADEVRTLSTTTTEHVKQIESVIQAVQNEVQEAVVMMNDIVSGADLSIESAMRADNVLKEIEAISSSSAKMAGAISDDVEKQVLWCAEISKIVLKNAEQVININKGADEQKKGSDLIIKSVEEIKEIAEKLKHSMVEQSKGSEIISKTISDTHNFSENIMSAIDNLSGAISHVVNSLKNINRVAESNLRTMYNHDKMAKHLVELEERLSSEMKQFKLPLQGEIK
jgi:methyl-accepting chemotaxis protein